MTHEVSEVDYLSVMLENEQTSLLNIVIALFRYYCRYWVMAVADYWYINPNNHTYSPNHAIRIRINSFPSSELKGFATFLLDGTFLVVYFVFCLVFWQGFFSKCSKSQKWGNLLSMFCTSTHSSCHSSVRYRINWTLPSITFRHLGSFFCLWILLHPVLVQHNHTCMNCTEFFPAILSFACERLLIWCFGHRSQRNTVCSHPNGQTEI